MRADRTVAVILSAVLPAMIGGCGGDENAAEPSVGASEPAQTQPASPPEPDGEALRRELETLNRRKAEAQAELEALEAEKQALSSAMAESEAEQTRLEEKVRRLQDQTR